MSQLALFDAPAQAPADLGRRPARARRRAPVDTGTVAVGSVCTGYGGLEMALALAGVPVELAWVADNDPAASKLLALRYPGVANLGDVKLIDWASLARVAILTAGYPCQPFSLAGQRKGIDDPRYILHGIRILRPPYVFLENVPGHRSRGFGTVLGDLATLGYVGSWVSLRASDVGAAHRRERVFILARPADAEGVRLRDGWTQGGQGLPAPVVGGDSRALMPTPAARLGKCTSITPATAARREARGRGVNLDDWAALLPTPRATDGTNGGQNQRGSKGDIALPSAVQPGRWGQYGGAIERWAGVIGRPAPEPTEPSRSEAVRLAPVFVEWLMGLDLGWVTDVPGLTRNDQLRLLGNGVVRHQGAAAFRILYGRSMTPRAGDGR